MSKDSGKKVLAKRTYATTGAGSGSFYQELLKDGVLQEDNRNTLENASRLKDRFIRDFYNEVTAGDINYKNTSELGGLRKYESIVDDLFVGVGAASALRYIGMILDYRKQDLHEGGFAHLSRVAANKLKLDSRFNLMAEAAARAALEGAAGGDLDKVKEGDVEALAATIKKAGSGVGDLFKDFVFASKNDIGKEETPIKMLHELPEIKAIASKMVTDSTYKPLENQLTSDLKANKGAYIFGRKEIVKEGVKLVVGKAVDASVAQLAAVSQDPYLKDAAKELKSKMAHDIDPSFAAKVKKEMTASLLKTYVSTKAVAEKGKMTVKDLAARLAHPVGKGLLEAAVSEALLKRTETLETVSKGLFEQISNGWKSMTGATGKVAASVVKASSKKLGVTTEFGLAKWLKGDDLKATDVANKALANFLEFDPKNPKTFIEADKLKVGVKKEVASRRESYAQASMAVDKMVTEEMRSARRQPKFNLHPLVRENLVRYLHSNSDLDQVAFCKSLCDQIFERGRVNKTLTLAHFEPKGDRTQGTWSNYFRKCIQAIRKSTLFSKFPELPKWFTPSAAAFTTMLDGVRESVKTGVMPLEVYSSHRDAQLAVQSAISAFNDNNKSAGGIIVDGKTLPSIEVDKDVQDALAKQITLELEKARVAGKKIYMSDVISALQPGMRILATRMRDANNGKITAKSVRDSAVAVSSTKGFQKPNAAPSQTLADFCKQVVGMDVPVKGDASKYSVKTMGMTRTEAVNAVLEEAMKGHEKSPGFKEVKRDLQTVIDNALIAYDDETKQAPYTSSLIEDLKKKVKDDCIKTEVVKDKNGKESTKLVTKNLVSIKPVALEKAGKYNNRVKVLEANRKQDALKHVGEQYAVVTLPDGSLDSAPVNSVAVKSAEALLPTINSAKAFLEYIANNGGKSSTPESKAYCMQLIKDPKYAEVLHYSRFGDESKQLGKFLLDADLIDKPMFDAIKDQQDSLAYLLNISPKSDIKDIAKKLNVIEKAGLGGNKTSKSTFFLGLLNGTAVPVDGLADKPVLIEGPDVKTRSEAEELLRFVHNNVGKATLGALTAAFVSERNISVIKGVDKCKVNGVDLVDYVKTGPSKLDLNTVKVKAITSRLDPEFGGVITGMKERQLAAAKAAEAKLLAVAERNKLIKGVERNLEAKAAATAAAEAAIPLWRRGAALAARGLRAVAPTLVSEAFVGRDPKSPAVTPGGRSTGSGKKGSTR